MFTQKITTLFSHTLKNPSDKKKYAQDFICVILVVNWFKKYMDFHKWYHLIGGGRAEPGVGCQIMTPLTQKDMGQWVFGLSFKCPKTKNKKMSSSSSVCGDVIYRNGPLSCCVFGIVH